MLMLAAVPGAAPGLRALTGAGRARTCRSTGRPCTSGRAVAKLGGHVPALGRRREVGHLLICIKKDRGLRGGLVPAPFRTERGRPPLSGNPHLGGLAGCTERLLGLRFRVGVQLSGGRRNAPFGGTEAKAGKETAVASKVKLPEFRSADPKAVDSIVEGMERTGTK